MTTDQRHSHDADTAGIMINPQVTIKLITAFIPDFGYTASYGEFHQEKEIITHLYFSSNWAKHSNYRDTDTASAL